MLSHRNHVSVTNTDICDAFRDLVAFAQFKKCEKHPWRSVTFSKVAGHTKQHKINVIHICSKKH